MTNITEIFGIKLLIIIYNNCSSLTINQMKLTGSEQIILLFGMDWVCFQAPYQWPKDVCNINVFRASWARTPPLCLGLNSRISPRDCESTSRRRGRRQHFDMCMIVCHWACSPNEWLTKLKSECPLSSSICSPKMSVQKNSDPPTNIVCEPWRTVWWT